MAWDKELPDGDKKAYLLDDDVRTNNAAVEAAIDQEHRFATGGNQSGHHEFMHGTTAAIAAVTDMQNKGALAFCTDYSGYTEPVPCFYSDEWHYVLTNETLTIVNDWTAGQHCSTVDLTPHATDIASVLSDSNMFYLDLNSDAELNNPTGTPGADKGGVWFYVVQQDDAGPWQLTYGTDFVGAPVLSDTKNDIDVLMAVHDDAENIHLFNLTRGTYTPATDAQANDGVSTTLVVTPANLRQNYDATVTKGSYRLPGTGKIVQWFHGALADHGSVAFAEDFDDVDYTISMTVENAESMSWAVEATTVAVGGFDVRLSASTIVHVFAIGNAA